MRNDTVYRCSFSKLRMHAFGKDQVLAYKGEVEIYQARDSPELWKARPHFETGRHKWEAATAKDLAAIIQDDFEFQTTHWVGHRVETPTLKPQTPKHVIPIDLYRRRA